MRLNSKVRLISHRSYGFHGPDPLISVIHLCAGGIHVNLPFTPQLVSTTGIGEYEVRGRRALETRLVSPRSFALLRRQQLFGSLREHQWTGLMPELSRLVQRGNAETHRAMPSQSQAEQACRLSGGRRLLLGEGTSRRVHLIDLVVPMQRGHTAERVPLPHQRQTSSLAPRASERYGAAG